MDNNTANEHAPTLKKEALRLANLGFHVLPLKKADKVPEGRLVKNGFKNASNNSTVVGQDWWGQFPSCNIGIATAASGLLVIDIDPRNGGDPAAFEQEHLAGITTPISESGRRDGGRHYYFKAPGFPVKDAPVAPGIDVKAQGYVVAPPSIHPETGNAYRWITDPEDCQAAELPDSLVQLLQATVTSRSPSPALSAEDPIPKGHRHHALLLMGGKLRRASLAGDQILNALQSVNEGRCEPPLPVDKVDRIAMFLASRPVDDDATPVAVARKYLAMTAAPNDRIDSILVNDLGNAVADHLVVDQTEAALTRANKPPKLFQVDGSIVTVDTDTDDVPTLRRLLEPELPYHISMATRFTKIVPARARKSDRKPKRREVTINVPRDVVKQVYHRCTADAFPHLAGLTTLPSFREDGSIISTPGYDPLSRLYYQPSERLRGIRVPDSPTQTDAQDALKQLMVPFQDVPFDDQASRANYFATILSFAAQPLLGQFGLVPLVMITSPDMSTGKSWLSEAVGLIGQGVRPAKRGTPHTNEEWQKTLMAAAMAGSRFLFFDNHAGHIAGRDLDRMATAGKVGGRILGKSEETVVSYSPIMVLNGNNVEPARDTIRRVVYIRLKADAAFKAKRDAERAGDASAGFKIKNVLQHIHDHLDQLVTATLTIVRAWVVAGRPPAPTMRRLDSFESWSESMAGILHFAGIDGFLDNADQVSDFASDELAGHADFLEAIRMWIGLQPFRAGEMAEEVWCANRDGITQKHAVTQREREHADAMEDLLRTLPERAATKLREPTSTALARQIGYTLKDLKGRDLPGRHELTEVAQSPNSKKSRQYRLTEKDKRGAFGGS